MQAPEQPMIKSMDELNILLKKAHIRLMRHPETCLYGGAMLMGESSVNEEAFTAYTDGFNKRYSAVFLSTLTLEEATALALHENLHVILKHIPRHLDLIKEDAKLANAAMDYVDNDIIMCLVDKTLCHLPKGGLYDPMFHNWSVREVYDYLKTGQPKPPPKTPTNPGQGQGQGQPQPPSGTPQRSKDSQGGEHVNIGGKDFGLEGLDEHDVSAMEGKTQEEMKELSEEIDEALRHGGLLAGRFGVKVPRVITDMLEPKVDWKRVLAEFVTNSTKGNDEYTWRRFNRHRLADDNYLPSVEDETVGEIIYAVDTSGSMTQAILNEGSGELASICQSCEPEKVRVLWWDTKVHGEQVFSENYDNLRKLLKPQGGGGTRVSCVSEYLTKKTVKADCIIIFTDGYLESGINWDTNVPTLWLVTSNKSFVPPRGQMVYIDNN